MAPCGDGMLWRAMRKPRPAMTPATTASSRYHHGNLVEALLAATIAIIEERGVEHVSVREAARRAGVSPGAPFRHFASKTALMTAVGEQAMDRLKAAVDAALGATAGEPPLRRLHALGAAYLEWALRNPTHFQIISSRSLIDISVADRIRHANDEIRQAMAALVEEARAGGFLTAEASLDQLLLVIRALGYGLARMAIDGHFPEWHRAEPPEQALPKALDLFMALLEERR